ncbi:hypothetical protein KCP78_07835 [Salmonella enterica subsp. enterica]|nr:hypothetical protein KCP78_07835 [Salmonella enterica subsp. enterica]
MQVRSVHGIRHLSWQGDTLRALSLTVAGTDTRSNRGLDNHYAGSITAKARGKSLAFIGGGCDEKVSVSFQ